MGTMDTQRNDTRAQSTNADGTTTSPIMCWKELGVSSSRVHFANAWSREVAHINCLKLTIVASDQLLCSKIYCAGHTVCPAIIEADKFVQLQGLQVKA